MPALRTLCCLSLFLVAGLAHAVPPPVAPSAGQPVVSVVPTADATMPESVWLTEDVTALRWPDAEITAIKLEKGSKVDVVWRTEKLVRIFQGGNYGWVPAKSLSKTAPASEAVGGTEAMPDNTFPTEEAAPPPKAVAAPVEKKPAEKAKGN